MNFDTLRVRDIRAVVRYVPSITHWTAENRREHILGIQLRGSGLHDLGDRRLVLSENCVYFLNQREDFSVRLTEMPDEAYSVHFTTFEPIETPSFCHKAANSAEVLRLIEQIDRLWQRDHRGDAATLALFYRLCDLLSDIRRRPYAQSDARMAAARDYMDLHFKETDCLDGAAALCGVTRRRFADLFCAACGTTPGRYLTAKKLALARELLSVGELSIAEVAALSGFSDPYYFSRVFAAEAGLPPSRYRKQKNAP